MPSCECCWSASRWIELEPDDGIGTRYSAALREHEDRGCACTKPTLDGARLRAGQFWIDGKDSRYTDEEWAGVLLKREARDAD